MSTAVRDVPAEARNMIGRRRDHVFEVTARDIRRYVDAIGAPVPADSDQGADGLVSPPLFHHVLMFDDVPAEDLRPDGLPPELDLPLPVTHVVGGGADIEIQRPIRAGDVVTVSSFIEDIYTKAGRSGDLYFVVLVTTYSDQNGEVLVIERSTYVNR